MLRPAASVTGTQSRFEVSKIHPTFPLTSRFCHERTSVTSIHPPGTVSSNASSSSSSASGASCSTLASPPCIRNRDRAINTRRMRANVAIASLLCWVRHVARRSSEPARSSDRPNRHPSKDRKDRVWTVTDRRRFTWRTVRGSVLVEDVSKGTNEVQTRRFPGGKFVATNRHGKRATGRARKE